MSAILQDAKNLYEKSLSYEEWQDLSRDMWPDLVAEIRRIRGNFLEQTEEVCDSGEMLLPDGNTVYTIGVVGKLVAEINRLREEIRKLLNTTTEHEYNATIFHQQLAAKDIELARWQKIAIEATAKANTYRMIAIQSGYPEKCHAVPATGDLLQAAKEINLQVTREAGYVDRLEKEFLDHMAARIYYESIPYVSDYWSWHDYPEEPCQMKPKQWFRDPAQSALNKIREGK